MQLDLFGRSELERKFEIDELIIEKIIWYCNFLVNTNLVYTQKEISDYILHMLIERTYKMNNKKTD